jgi:hypothetical protein
VIESIKELVNDADQPLRQQLDDEKRHFLDNLRAPQAGQAIDDFLQRRQG